VNRIIFSHISAHVPIPPIHQAAYIVRNLPAGNYYWKVQAVDQGYKGGDWSVVSSFEVKNIRAFFSADTVCQNDTTQFSNQSTAFGAAIENYLWDFGDGTTSDLENPYHVFNTSGVPSGARQRAPR